MEPQNRGDVREALQYWCGSSRSVFRSDRLPNSKLEHLLRGIAAAISSSFGQEDHRDLTPLQLAAFYRRVGGNYDTLFLETPPSTIAFIYKSLGCLHSLQPDPRSTDVEPVIPALKPKGFVTWQSIQILLGPAEHVPFIQEALQIFDVVDPDTDAPFPKYLPTEAFPNQPNQMMLEWHQGVSERLQREAEEEARGDMSSSQSSIDSSRDGQAEKRASAASYFSNPHFRGKDGRPAIVRQITRAPALFLKGGQMIVATVRNIADPQVWKPHGNGEHSHHDDDTDDSDGVTPTAGPTVRHTDYSHRHRHSDPARRDGPRYEARQERRGSPRRGRRRDTDTSTDSSDSDSPQRQPARRPRSHEPPASPREYYHKPYPQPVPPNLQSHRSPISPSDGHMQNEQFRPSNSPIFAAKVTTFQQSPPQQQQRPGYFDLGRPNLAQRSSYDNGGRRASTHGVYGAPHLQPPQSTGTWPKTTRPSPTGDYQRQRQGREPVDQGAVTGVHGRRYLDESPWRS